MEVFNEIGDNNTIKGDLVRTHQEKLIPRWCDMLNLPKSVYNKTMKYLEHHKENNEKGIIKKEQRKLRIGLRNMLLRILSLKFRIKFLLS